MGSTPARAPLAETQEEAMDQLHFDEHGGHDCGCARGVAQQTRQRSTWPCSTMKVWALEETYVVGLYVYTHTHLVIGRFPNTLIQARLLVKKSCGVWGRVDARGREPGFHILIFFLRLPWALLRLKFGMTSASWW